MGRTTPIPPPIADVPDLFTLARALEAEAARRYRELADRMARRGENELASLFTFLAGLEDKHGDQVVARGATFGAPPDPTRIAWEVPENFDEEAARSARLTPYGALAIAVRNEERAFAFYCHAAVSCPPALAAVVEDLARDELQHAALLRRGRRKAWRKEGGRPQPALPVSAAALNRDITARRRAMASGHLGLAQRLRQSADPELAAAFERIGKEQDAEAAPSMQPPAIEHALKELEQEFETMIDIASRSGDADIVSVAQSAAEDTVRWLALAGGSWRNRLLKGSRAAGGSCS